MLDLIRTLTNPIAETLGEFGCQIQSWLAFGFAIAGFKFTSEPVVASTPILEPIPRARSLPVRPSPITVAPPGPDAGIAEVHLARLSGIVNGALTSAERATTTHASAAVSLDAAEYALNRLLDELKGVMAPPIAAVAHCPRPVPERPCLPNGLASLAA